MTCKVWSVIILVKIIINWLVLIDSAGLNFCIICFNVSSNEAKSLVGFTGYLVDVAPPLQVCMPSVLILMSSMVASFLNPSINDLFILHDNHS